MCQSGFLYAKNNYSINKEEVDSAFHLNSDISYDFNIFRFMQEHYKK